MALSDNLVAYWSLDEASGNAVDAHGSNDLTQNGTIASVAGKVGNARQLESANSEYFSLADNTDLSTGDIDFTLAGWVNMASLINQSFATKGGGTNGEYDLRFAAGGTQRFQFRFWGSAGFGNAGSVLADNAGGPSTSTWYFIVAWHDSTNNECGISVNDGTPDTAAVSTGVIDGTDAFALGAYAAFLEYANATLDEWGLWKRVLSSAEITELYNGGSGRDYAYISGGGGASIIRKSSGLLLVGCG